MSDYLLLSPYENEHGITSNYLQGDTQEKHIYNRNRFGSKWLWDNATIEYKMNSHGYRMEKELDKIDFDNYYAFFGCSFTVGIGLPLTTTFPYMISDKNKVDVWEAVGGAKGTGDRTHNWSGYLDKSPKQPRNGLGQTLDVNVYKAWKNNNKIYWSVWDLDKGQPVAQSANANENVYGASVSKAVVAAHYFDKFSNNGVLPNTKDYWYVVTALIPSNNNSWKTLQDKIDPNRLLTNSWSKSKGYNNMEPAIRPNKINAVGMNKFWDDISKNKLKGSGVIAKSCLAGSTHRNRSQLYIPSEYYVGTKTGSYLTYNHDSGFVGKIGGKWFAISVLTSGGGRSQGAPSQQLVFIWQFGHNQRVDTGSYGLPQKSQGI